MLPLRFILLVVLGTFAFSWAGPLAQWDFDHEDLPVMGQTPDAVGTHHAVLINDPTFAPGWSGNAVFASGTLGEAVAVADPDGLLTIGSRDFTLAFWVNMSSHSNASGEMVFLEKFSGAAGPGLTLSSFNPGSGEARTFFLWTMAPGGSTHNFSFSSQVSLPIETWQHLAITRSGALLTLYHNGNPLEVLIDPRGANFDFGDSGLDFLMMRRNSGDERIFSLHGGLDSVRLYHHALDASEILTLARQIGAGLDSFYVGTEDGWLLEIQGLGRSLTAQRGGIGDTIVAGEQTNQGQIHDLATAFGTDHDTLKVYAATHHAGILQEYSADLGLLSTWDTNGPENEPVRAVAAGNIPGYGDGVVIGRGYDQGSDLILISRVSPLGTDVRNPFGLVGPASPVNYVTSVRMGTGDPGQVATLTVSGSAFNGAGDFRSIGYTSGSFNQTFLVNHGTNVAGHVLANVFPDSPDDDMILIGTDRSGAYGTVTRNLSAINGSQAAPTELLQHGGDLNGDVTRNVVAAEAADLFPDNPGLEVVMVGDKTILIQDPDDDDGSGSASRLQDIPTNELWVDVVIANVLGNEKPEIVVGSSNSLIEAYEYNPTTQQYELASRFDLDPSDQGTYRISALAQGCLGEVPEPPPPPLVSAGPGDFNTDGAINLLDFAAFNHQWLDTQNETDYLMMPDTLDLQYRAALAINALTRCTDETQGYRVYWLGTPNQKPPLLSQLYGSALSNLYCKFTQSLALCRMATQSSLNLEVDQTWKQTIHDIFSAPTAPSCTIGVDGGRMVATLAHYYLDDNDSTWLTYAQRMVDRSLSEFVDKGSWGYYGNPAGPPQGWDATFHGWILQGLAHYYRVTNDPTTGNLGNKIAYFLKDHAQVFDANGHFLASHGGGSGPHFHHNGNCMEALSEWALASGDATLGSFVNQCYQFGRSKSEMHTGFVPEYVDTYPGGRNLEDCEACCLTDMILTGLNLTRAGWADYWDDLDVLIRNMGSQMQLTSGYWLYDMVKDYGYSSVGAGQTGFEVPFRIVGDVAGWGGVNDFYKVNPGIQHCCLGNYGRVWYHLWSQILGYDSGSNTLKVHLLLNRFSDHVDVTSFLPYEGRVELQVHTGLADLQIRMPAHVNLGSVQVSINGLTQSPAWNGRYLLTGPVSANDLVVVTFALSERSEQVSVGGGATVLETYDIIIRGHTVVSIDPSGSYYPYFEGEHYRTGPIQYRKVKRIVGKDIKW